MEIKGLIKYLAFLIFSVSIFTACSHKVKEVQSDIEIPKLSQVTVLETQGDSCNVYRAESRGLYKIGSGMPRILDMTYSTAENPVVQLAYLSKGQNMTHNSIKIYSNGKMMVLDTFYSASDIMLNPSGNKLAFRSYKEDALESAQGLKIFDINSRELLNLKSKVLVSGNVYSWMDENNILYYGSTGGTQDPGKIYKYNFQNGTEEVFLDNIEGYCTFISSAGNGVVYLKENEEGSSLIYYNNTNKSSKVISNNMSKIYKACYHSSTGKVFFNGIENGEENPELYCINLKDFKVSRITYDFPSSLDEESNLCFDKEGNVFFTAMQGVYMYNVLDNSVNLISSHAGEYKVYQDINN